MITCVRDSIAEITFKIDSKSAFKLKDKEHHSGYGYGTVHIRNTNRQHGANDLLKRAKVSDKARQTASSTDQSSCAGRFTKPDTQKNDLTN